LLVASLARLGFLANLISKPIVTGFTAAAGVLISMSQVKSLLGIDMASVNTIIDFFSAFIPAVSTTNTWYQYVKQSFHTHSLTQNMYSIGPY